MLNKPFFFYKPNIILDKVIAITPGSPKIPETPSVKGVNSILKEVKPLVKCKINKILKPSKAEVIKVFKNFLVRKAKIKTDNTATAEKIYTV